MALLAVLLGVAASGGRGQDSPLPTSGEVIGTIVDVRSEGGEVRAFTLSSEGKLVEVSIADDVEYGFDLDHLKEHLTTGDPVRCKVEDRGGGLYALSILDA